MKTGTQVIDRVWRYIKDLLGRTSAKPGSTELRIKIRAAQWCYWHLAEDLWKSTGEMLERAWAE